MADTNETGAAADEAEVTEGAEGAADTGAESAEGTEGAADGEGEGADAGEGADKTEADKGKKDTKEEKVDEPPVRKKAVDYIIERKDRKIAKLSGAGKDGKSGAAAGAGEDEGEGGVAAEDKKMILDTVMPILEPVLKERAEAQDNNDLKTFLDTNKDFKPYEAKIRQYMQHPTRAHLPIEAIAFEVAGKDLLAIGAKRGKQADDKGKETHTGGGATGGGGEKTVWDMTPEEFAAKQQEIRTKQR